MNDESQYEYFAGHAAHGTAVWSREFSDLKPIAAWNNNMPLLKNSGPSADWARPAIIHHSMADQFSIRMGDWKLIEGSGDGDYPRDENGRIKIMHWQLQENELGGSEMDYFQLEPDGTLQLYNLRKDPGETDNLAEDHPARVGKMHDELNRIRDSGRSVPPHQKF